MSCALGLALISPSELSETQFWPPLTSSFSTAERGCILEVAYNVLSLHRSSLIREFTMSTLLRSLCSLACLFIVTSLAPAARADTAADVASANSSLKRAESNLELVDGSIGHLKSPPKGSAAKLAKMRLDGALGDIEAAKKKLEGLSGAGVAEATKRYNEAVKLHKKLSDILTGAPPAPAPTPTPSPTPDPAPDPKPDTDKPKTVKLGYPHADNFKNTLFTLRRVEADTASLTNLIEALRPVKDQLTINHRKTAGAMEKIKETRRQAGFVSTGLAKIPSNGEGVAEAGQRLANARSSVDRAEAYFKPLHAQLMNLINPANYPKYTEDLNRLSELSRAYNNLDYLFREQRAAAAETYGQLEVANAECVRIAQAYLRLMEQETELGKQIEIAGNNFLGGHAAFTAKAQEQAAGLPADIRKDLAEADQYANEAVQNQKPMWFTGGIPQRMEWADDKLALYHVLDPKGAVAVQAEVDAMKASLAQRADSLKELIIRENPLPNDRYVGADREKAIAVAVSAWKIQEKDFELLTVRIPSEAWSRETKWTYSNGTWYFVDKSTLQIRLIVADKANPAQAIDRPINVRMDHQKGDALIGVPMRSFDEELQPNEYLLRDKI